MATPLSHRASQAQSSIFPSSPSSPKQVLPPPYQTPLPPTFTTLIRGSFPEEVFSTLQNHFVSNLGNPEIDIHLLPDRQCVSSVFRITVGGEPKALFKIRQGEPGAPAWNGTRTKDQIHSKDGCQPGTGAFVEVLVSLYLQELALRIEGISEKCVIPKLAYVQMGHPVFILPPILVSPIANTYFGFSYQSPVVLIPKERTPGSPALPLERATSVRGTGSLHEFIPNSTPVSEAFLKTLPKIVSEFLAVVDIITLNADRHLGNLLQTPDGRVVPIDHAYSLSEHGLEGGSFCWENLPALQEMPSLEIKQFIEQIDPSSLGKLEEKLRMELESNLQPLPEDQQVGERISLGENRMITHQIALRFLKNAMGHGWSLGRVARACHQKSPLRHEGVVYDIAQEILKTPFTGTREEYIELLCSSKF